MLYHDPGLHSVPSSKPTLAPAVIPAVVLCLVLLLATAFAGPRTATHLWGSSQTSPRLRTAGQTLLKQASLSRLLQTPSHATPAVSAAEGGDAVAESLVRELLEDEFDAVVAGPTPVLVDYYATWCGPCRLMEPKVAELAREYDGRVLVYKMDCGTNGSKCRDLGIKMLPTFHVWKNGELLEEMFGTNADKLEQMVKDAAA
eukprot:EG_transcript_28944